MKEFKFRLESYLKLKVYEEKNAWSEVLKQQGRVYQIEESIHNINRAMSEGREKLAQDSSVSQLVEESINALNVKLKMLYQEKIAEEKTLDILLKKHMEKKKEAKIIENLKNKKKADFTKEKSKKDQNNLEEIARTLRLTKDGSHE